MSFNINNMLNSVQHYTYRNNSVAVVVYNNNPHIFVASKNTVSMVIQSCCCAISETGKYMLSCHYTGGAYLSINYGSTFTQAPISTRTCAMSGNGQYMLIGKYGGYIHISTDSGTTFIENTTGSFARNWTSIKMSYDGQYCLASSDFVYLSTNYGANFAVTTDTSGTNNSTSWGYNTDIAMSKTGQYMVCISTSTTTYDSIKISTDYGATWKQKNLLVNFSTACAMSEDGQTIYLGSYYNPKLYKITDLSNNSPTITEITAAAAMACQLILLATDPLYIFISDLTNSKMYYSIDGGTTFTQINTTAYFTTGAITPDKQYIIGNNNYNNLYKLFISVPVYNNPYIFGASKNTINTYIQNCCAISSNGQYILSCHNTGGAYISINYGSTFTSAPISSATASTCAISSNGQFMLIGNNIGYIHRSTDSGANFTTGSLSKNWSSMKMSYDGQYCLASSDFVYLSSDSGATFSVTTDTSGTNNSAGWGYNADIAMSKTGQYMVCIKRTITYDLIKISTDYGVTWKRKNFTVLNNFSTSCAMSEDGQTIYIGSYYYTKLYKITNLTANSPTITEIAGAAAIYCHIILLATDPLYIFISDASYYLQMYYSIDGGTNFTQIDTTAYFSTGAITPDKQYIIGNNNYYNVFKLFISAPVYNNPHVFVASKNINSMLNILSCCAISSNGKYMLSCHSTNGAYLSTNYGFSFTKLTSPTQPYACAISGNGLNILIGQTIGRIYRTTNYGTSFTFNSNFSSWRSIKMSYDGQYCLASSDFVYLSSDSGATFSVTTDTSGTNNSASGGYNSNIAMSKTGEYMVCVKNTITYDSIKISTDYGATWKQKNFTVLNNFSTSCAMSEDGQTIYLGSLNKLKLYKITDLTANSPTITDISGAAAICCHIILLATDPLYIFISDVANSKMYYSIDGGTNFTQINTTDYFSTCAITPNKQYIIGNNYNNRLLYVSGP